MSKTEIPSRRSRHDRGARRSERAERAERRAAARERKRERLIEAAIGIVRRDGPGVSMDDIAREAGVTKPIVYRVFGDREGLTGALADRFAAELSATLGAAIGQATDDRSRVEATIDAYLAFIERDPAIVRFLIHRGLADMEPDAVALPEFVRSVAGMIAEAIGEELRARRLDSGAAEPWAYAIVGAVHLAGDAWLSNRTMPRVRLVEYLTTLVWDGMQTFDTVPTADDRDVKGTK